MLTELKDGTAELWVERQTETQSRRIICKQYIYMEVQDEEHFVLKCVALQRGKEEQLDLQLVCIAHNALMSG